MLLVEACRETEIGELDVATSVEQDVVRLDITGVLSARRFVVAGQRDLPMDEAQLVHSFQSQCDLGHVEPSDVFREDFVLDQHGHEITTWQELHEHVEEGRVLE